MPLKAALQALKVAVQRPTLKMVNNTLQGDLVTQEAHAGMDNRVWGLLKGACFCRLFGRWKPSLAAMSRSWVWVWVLCLVTSKVL